MAITDYITRYIANEFGSSLALKAEDEIGIRSTGPSIPNLITPLAITPIASPFIRRKERSFPLYRKPPEQRGVIPEYEWQEQDGGDDFEKVEIEDLPTDLESLLGDTSKEGIIDVFSREFQAGPQVTKSTFGVKQSFNPGRFVGQFTSMATVGMPLPGFSASYVGEKNLQQLQYVQAMAGLGHDGYGIGVVNGQVVGVTPDHIVGTVPNASPEDLKRIRETLVGKSGPMRAGIEAMQTKFAPSATTSDAEKKFQDEIIKSKLSDDIKSQILGFDPLGAFSPGRLQSQFGQYTPPSYRASVGLDQFIKDKEEAEESRKVGGDLEGVGGFIPAQGSPLPTVDISDADKNITENTNIFTPAASLTQASQIQPSGYVSDESGDEPEGPSGGGFGGGGWTAYGGRISRAYGGGESKGFASKTPNTVIVKGVGLIKPEETFLRTDMVDDRYAFDARDGDYVVNGPASERFKKPLLVLAQLGINNLKNKGVDIRVGNPKISSRDKVPLITASSENYFPKEIVENINPNDPEEGYRILDAINNVGKPEVKQLKNRLDNKSTDKSRYKANEGIRAKKIDTGSFMTMEEADKALGVKPEPVDPKTLKFFKLFNAKNKPKRGDVEQLLDRLTDRDKLALLIATETISSKDSLETLESVGQVVMNRVNDKQYPDFKNVNTLDEVLKQRSFRGKGSKMFQFDGLEPTSVKNRINEFLNKGGIKGYKKAMMAAENVLTRGSGEPDYMTERMPFNVLFYDKAGSPKSISRREKI